MPIPGNLLTTAMAVMPHRDVDRALEIALSLDVPFWPQLPLVSYYEDMYVQASEHFPGIILDMEKQKLRFSTEKFIAEFEETMAHFDEPAYFDISEQYSVVYHRFLKMDFSNRPAIRGQIEGPISFGFNVVDQDDRPILFNDTVRPFLLEFMAKRVNVQLQRLKELNPNAFMFVDEPGLQFLFSALAGYSDLAARGDMENFFAMECTFAEIQIGTFFSGWTWTYFQWTSTVMVKCLPSMDHLLGSSWTGVEGWSGASCQVTWNHSIRKTSIVWNNV